MFHSPSITSSSQRGRNSLNYSRLPAVAIILTIIGVLLWSSSGIAQSSLCTAWDNQEDLPFNLLSDGERFTLQHNGSANAGERFFVDFAVSDTRRDGYSFYFGPSVSFSLPPEDDTTGFIGTLLYEADGSETDLQFVLEDDFDEGGGFADTVFGLANFRCTLDPVDDGDSDTGFTGTLIDFNVMQSAGTSGYAVVSGARQSAFYVFRHFLDGLRERQRNNRSGQLNYSDSGTASSGSSDTTLAEATGSVFFGQEETASNLIIQDGEYSTWRLFTSGTGAIFDQDTTATNSGVYGKTWTGSVGIENMLNPNLLIGLAVTSGASDGEVGGLADIDVKGVVGHLYGSYLKDGFFVDMRYAAGWMDVENSRNAAPGVVARSEADSHNHAVIFETGKHVRAGKWTTGPFLGIDYIHGSLDPFTEQGAGKFNLIVSEQNFDSLVSQLGWQVSKDDETNWGSLRSIVRASWNHEYLDGVGGEADFNFQTSPFSRFVNGNFAGRTASNGGTFTVEEPGDDYLSLGLGLVGNIGPDNAAPFCRLSVNYENQLFRRHFAEHYFSGLVTFEF